MAILYIAGSTSLLVLALGLISMIPEDHVTRTPLFLLAFLLYGIAGARFALWVNRYMRS